MKSPALGTSGLHDKCHKPLGIPWSLHQAKIPEEGGIKLFVKGLNRDFGSLSPSPLPKSFLSLVVPMSEPLPKKNPKTKKLPSFGLFQDLKGLWFAPASKNCMPVLRDFCPIFVSSLRTRTEKCLVRIFGSFSMLLLCKWVTHDFRSQWEYSRLFCGVHLSKLSALSSA